MQNEHVEIDIRITPACAGRSRTKTEIGGIPEDHPRVCGEKYDRNLSTMPRRGSPPRVRGEVAQSSSSRSTFRITPACAGRRHGIFFRHPYAWDHPRVCGEKVAPFASVAVAGGSPPRVRGEVLYEFVVATLHGITPACAGRSVADVQRLERAQDHPRVCGEKSRSLYGLSWKRGSPPRVRGEASASLALLAALGITPACAGRSSRIGRIWEMIRDHPRVCGEKPERRKQWHLKRGSPPRVRGEV